MRIALISDIHANILALEAALREIPKHAPDQIVSLGDQVNLGPCPRETLEQLRAHNVTCLHGNHERYILSVLAGDPAYDGANFDSLRFNAKLLTAQEITFPKHLQIENVTLCHAMPDDDRFPVFDAVRAAHMLRGMTFERRTNIICGHGHNPVSIRMQNISINCVGSTGCMDAGTPGQAIYTILDVEKDFYALRSFVAVYDPNPLRGLFRSSGMAEFCPIMAHIACLQMERNCDNLMPFVTLAGQLSREKGEKQISHATWEETDRRFCWPDGMTTAEYWRT